MSKVPYNIVIDELSSDHWQQMYDDEWDDIVEEYWSNVASGEMSWQWYMYLKQHQDWYPVVINNDYKNVMVDIWIKENYPSCEFEYEKNHFLIKDSDVATMVALKWS